MPTSLNQSNEKSPRNKPTKPYPDFPLFAHATGRWAKKIRGKFHYFGPWNDPDSALIKYLEQKDDLHAGRTPRSTSADGVTIRDLLNRFLTAKQHHLDTGEITARTFRDYSDSCKRVSEFLGLTRLVEDLHSQDFERFRRQLATTRGLISLGNEIQRIRVLFKYAFDADLIEKPVRFGPTFKRPTRKALRKDRQSKGLRMFEAEEIRSMLGATERQLHAMILLGINCGFGNHDCGTLTQQALDLEKGWVDFPRPKTGVLRRCHLWNETNEAIRVSLDHRPVAKDETHENLVFITKYGKPWAKNTPDSPVTKETSKLLKGLGLHRPGLGFYALRHTFETIGGETRDQVAVDHIMGHVRDDMATVYRERISDERLQAVTDFVHEWLFAED